MKLDETINDFNAIRKIEIELVNPKSILNYLEYSALPNITPFQFSQFIGFLTFDTKLEIFNIIQISLHMMIDNYSKTGQYDIEKFMKYLSFYKQFIESSVNNMYLKNEIQRDKIISNIKRSCQLSFGMKKKDRLQKIIVSPKQYKKYRAMIQDISTKRIRHIDFGDKRYEQFKDSTRLKRYSKKNHGNAKRRQNYFNRHSGEKTKRKALAKEWKKSKGRYTARILSHQYLW